jgi:hypothetical protein
MKKRQYKVIISAIFGFLAPQLVFGANINYSNIISDAEAQNYQAMTQVQIRDFLRSKNSTLSNYFYTGYNPGPLELRSSSVGAVEDENHLKERSAVEIIYNAAYESQINPQFLLTMLQKEMSLIEDPSPTDRQYDFAMGYYCFDGQSCNPRWQGFGKQVRSTALQFRDYIDNIHTRPYQTGKTFVIEGEEITPENNVTAGLYNYTPHLHGNALFKTIWDRYGFGGETTLPVVLGVIPEGSLVRAKDGEDTETVYLIRNNTKQAFSSNTALVSRYQPDKILNVPNAELEKFSLGPNIKYPAYSILMGPDNKKYLLDGLQKRLISSDTVFRNLGFNPEEVIEVSTQDLRDISDGPAITDVATVPLGQLLKDKTTGGVYYAKDGKKYPIVEPELIALNYPDLKVKIATSQQLDALQKESAVKLNDGTLILSPTSNQVYVIAAGKRRWIQNEETFLGLGYSWANIKKVSERVLKLHQVGEAISL